MLLLLVALLGCRSYSADRFDAGLREAAFDACLQQMELSSGAGRRGMLDVDDLRSRYRDRAIAATQPSEFYGLLRDLLMELDDPHLAIHFSSKHWEDGEIIGRPGRCYFVTIGDDLYIGYPESEGVASPDRTSLAPGEARSVPAIVAALETQRNESDLRWEKVLAIDGRVPTLIGGVRQGLGLLLTALVVTVERDGQPYNLSLLRDAAVTLSSHKKPTWHNTKETIELLLQSQEPPQPDSVPDENDEPDEKPIFIPSPFRDADRITAEDSPIFHLWKHPDFSYVRVTSLSKSKALETRKEFAERVDRAFAELDTGKPLIVDLSSNRGGNSGFLSEFVDPFLPEGEEELPFSYQTATLYNFWLWKVKSVTEARFPTNPSARVPSVPIFVLVDQNTASSAEVAASILRSRRGAQLIGETTVGAEYALHRFTIFDGTYIEFGAGGGMEAGCEPFQGTGLKPDIEIGLTIESVRELGLNEARRDLRRTLLAAALRQAGVNPTEVLRESH